MDRIDIIKKNRNEWFDRAVKYKTELKVKDEIIRNLKRVIKSALGIKPLWEPAESMENIDEGKALLKMAEQFEQVLKGDIDNG